MNETIIVCSELMFRRQSEQIGLGFFLYTHCKRSLVVVVVVVEGEGVIYVKWNHRARLSVCLSAHFRARPSVGIYVGMMLQTHVTSNRCNVL